MPMAKESCPTCKYRLYEVGDETFCILGDEGEFVPTDIGPMPCSDYEPMKKSRNRYVLH